MKNNKNMQVLAVLSALLLAGCAGESSGAGQGSTRGFTGEFTVQLSNGAGFDQNTPRARLHMVKDDLLGFRAGDWYFRIHGRSSDATTLPARLPLGKNNTQLSFKTEIGGAKRHIGCDTAKDPQGWLEITQNSGSTLSGAFQVEFVECADYYTAEPVNYPPEPLIVTGRFNELADSRERRL